VGHPERGLPAALRALYALGQHRTEQRIEPALGRKR
jgi:hypothetical protein